MFIRAKRIIYSTLKQGGCEPVMPITEVSRVSRLEALHADRNRRYFLYREIVFIDIEATNRLILIKLRSANTVYPERR